MRVEKQIDFKLSAQDKTKAVLGSVDQRLGSITKSVGIYSAAVGAAGLAAAAGLAVATSKAMASIDATAKLSDRLGITTEGLIGLRHAAELTGAGADTMDSSLERMNKRLGEAAAGTGEARKYLAALGLDVQDLLRLSPDQAFAEIAESVNGLSTQSEKAAVAAALFGREGVSLLNTMALGKDGLHDTAVEAEALGLSFSRIDAAKVEQANDAIHRARMAFSSTGRTIAVNLAPYITAVANGITDAAKESGGFKKEIGEAMEMGISGATNLAYAFTGTSVVLGAMKHDFLAFQSMLWEGLMKLREANLSVRESLPSFAGGPGSESYDEAKRILDEQRLIYNQIQLDKEAALASGADALELHDKIQAKLEAYRKKILEASQAAAVGAVSGGNGTLQPLPFNISSFSNLLGDGKAKSDPFAGYPDQAAGRLDSLRESLYTEEEAVQASYWNRWAIVQESQQLGLVGEQEYSDLMIEIGQKRADALADLDQRRLAVGMGILSMLQSGAMQSSKKGFEIAKVAAIAETTINTYKAATGAYSALASIPYVGPALGIAAAAAATAAGVANVNAIKSQSFGGGGGGGSISPPGYGAGTPGSPVVTQPTVQQAPAREVQVNLHLYGTIVESDGYVRNELAGSIKRALQDGVDFGL